MRYLSLCSGIEAATQAWHPLGWTPVAFSEIEKFPSAVLAHHYPDVPNWGDMTKFQEWPDATIDVLVGGTPCQSFSVAGLRKGLDDPRGNLALTYCAIAERYRPRWLVWENVPGVLSSSGGRDFGSFLGALGQLGYGFAYRVLDAQYVRTRRFSRAVPQRRRRVFVVGHLGDWRRAAAVLFDGESLSGNPPPRRKAGKAAPTIPSRSTAGGGLGTDFDVDGGTLPAAGHPIPVQPESKDGWPPDVAPTLNAAFGDKHGLENQHALNGAGLFTAVGALTAKGPEGLGAPEVDAGHYPPVEVTVMSSGQSNATIDTDVSPALNCNGDLAPIAFDTTQITSPDNGANPRPGEPCHPLASTAHAPAIAFNMKQHPDAWREHSGLTSVSGDQAVAFSAMPMNSGKDYTVRPTDVSQPLTTVQAGNHNQGGDFIKTRMAVRRLTPRECERLQGFPDDFTRIPWRGKDAENCPDGPRYKALGNSMAVNVMEWIGQRIALVEGLE